MGQIEVYEWLKENDNRCYRSPKGIYKRMLKDGKAVPNDWKKARIHRWLVCLENWGYLESRVGGSMVRWVRSYRLKVVKNEKEK